MTLDNLPEPLRLEAENVEKSFFEGLEDGAAAQFTPPFDDVPSDVQDMATDELMAALFADGGD